MVSDSATASASVSIRNHVLPPGASQTYLMLPPKMTSGMDRHREGGDAMSGEAKSGVTAESTATSAGLTQPGGVTDLPSIFGVESALPRTGGTCLGNAAR